MKLEYTIQRDKTSSKLSIWLRKQAGETNWNVGSLTRAQSVCAWKQPDSAGGKIKVSSGSQGFPRRGARIDVMRCSLVLCPLPLTWTLKVVTKRSLSILMTNATTKTSMRNKTWEETCWQNIAHVITRNPIPPSRVTIVTTLFWRAIRQSEVGLTWNWIGCKYFLGI